MKNKIIVLSSILVMAIVFFLGSYLVKTNTIENTKNLANELNEPFERSYSQSIGGKDAKVVVVEFFDPACETCRDFYPIVKSMLKYYPKKTKLVVRYLPLHKGADFYVKVLEASRKQGLYWETLETLYKNQHIWASHHHAKPELAWDVLKQTKLDLNKLREDIESPEINEIIRQDMEDARKLGVQKTPGFFVNGKPLISFGVNQFRDLVESEIQANYKKGE